MPTDDVSSARSCSGSNEEKTTTWRRARVIATFSRRSPPARFSGPKFSGSVAGRVGGEAGGEEDDVPLVALHVLQVLHEQALAVGAVQRGGQPVVVRVAEQRLDEARCWALKVTTPIDGVAVRRAGRTGGGSRPRSPSPRSGWCAAAARRSTRWNVPGTRTSETPRPSGSADARPWVGAGNDDSRFS